MADYLAALGPSLVRAGYDLVPIRPQTKRPVDDGWREAPTATESTVAGWVRKGRASWGIGVRATITPAVDIDIDHPILAPLLASAVRELYPTAPCRIGRAPRTLFVFRGVEGRKRVLKFAAGNSEGMKVEVLGSGQQFVAYGIHPDTGSEYHWPHEDILERPYDELPLLDVDKLLDHLTLVAADAGFPLIDRRERAPAAAGDDDSWAEYDTSKITISDTELRRSLMLVPEADSYERWTEIGFALWHQYDGEEPGLSMFHEWSEQSWKYDRATVDDIWQHYDPGKRKDIITARTILKLAKDEVKVQQAKVIKTLRTQLKEVTKLSELEVIAASAKKMELPILVREALASDVQKVFKRITEGSLALGAARALIRAEKPEITDTPDWLKGWVYDLREDLFYSTERRIALSRVGFDSMMAREVMTWQEVSEGLTAPENPPSLLALNRFRIQLIEGRLYMPGHPALFYLDGKLHANTYDGRVVPDPVPPEEQSDAEEAAVATALAHTELLFPDYIERSMFLSALSHIVKYPTKRLKFAIVLQGTEQDGKTWFMHLLAAVLGAPNVRPLNASQLEEGFNGWAEGAQVCFFEEIRLIGHSKFDVINRIKPLITNDVISIRRMRTDAYPAPNTASYILTTNFADALPLDAGDSRYFVLMSRFQTQAELAEFKEGDPTYYDRLYAACEYGGALRNWLLNYKCHPEFNGNHRAPQSRGRDRMREAGRTEIDDCLLDILEEDKAGLRRTLLSARMLSDELEERGHAVQGQGLNHALSRAGLASVGRRKVNRQDHRLWSVEASRWLDASAEEIASELNGL
jgi:hypothetical protein